jgi:transcriptional regulator with XRE-family HTH domain
LRKAREDKDLTHQEVAVLAGIKRQYYGMIENGKSKPSVEVAKKLAAVLEIDWTLFFDNEGNETLPKSLPEISTA